MWVVWKRDAINNGYRVAERICETKREADRVAKYENKWRGVYGFEFTVEPSPFNVNNG